MATHDINRLPVWAQARIRNLEIENAHLRGTVPTDDTDTYVRAYVADPSTPDRPLRRGSVIRFHVTDPDPNTPNRNDRNFGDIEAMVIHRNGRPQLQLRCPVGGLVVRPDSSNNLLIEAPGDW